MGKDVQGYRRLFGVLGPSTNTIVQPDFDDMRPAGVTNHYSRIYTPNSKAISDETFMAATHKISQGVVDAVRSVMTCEPDYLVMGMSAITFYGGAKGADEFQRMIERESGVSISIGAHSCAAALKAYGGIRRIAFLSPYYQWHRRSHERIRQTVVGFLGLIFFGCLCNSVVIFERTPCSNSSTN
ncbi:MAG: hypothetical protein EB102_00220 [Gammaproteobacteria bacterium]|nr:hypothetical protein [Gammaproteobacteria bacterium]